MKSDVVLVTGGAGFIGSHLVDRLVAEGWRVRVADNFSSGSLENLKRHLGSSNVEVLEADLKDAEKVFEAVKGVSAVFHFAANPEVRVSTTNPEIHFGENVVGAKLRHGVVYDFILKLMKQPDALEILGDETQVRSYISVEDAVEATVAAWRNLDDGLEAYNVGSMDWVTVNEIAAIIADVMGLKAVKYTYKPVLHGVGWPGDVKCVALEIDKLKHLGWRPRLSSREALAEAAKSILAELRG